MTDEHDRTLHVGISGFLMLSTGKMIPVQLILHTDKITREEKLEVEGRLNHTLLTIYHPRSP